MANDPKDRHVLAAAVRGRADVIVTANLVDFPTKALAPHGITAVSPDDFLLNHLDRHPRETMSCLAEQFAALRKPPVTPEAFLAAFSAVAPNFTAAPLSPPPPRT